MAMNSPELIDHDGKTKLHYAAEANDISMTQHLINTNHDIDIVDNQGNSPLMLAVQKNSYGTAILLVKAGANIYLDSKETAPRILLNQPKYPILMSQSYYRPLEKYCEFGSVMLEKLKKDCKNDEQLLLIRLRDFGFSLCQVVRFLDADVTRLMLRNGYSVDECDIESNGTTALHEAVTFGNFKNVKVLLEFGASVDALNNSQNPCLYYLYTNISKFRADDEERVEILKILIAYGALFFQTPKVFNKQSPLEFICLHGDLRSITTLMHYDVIVDLNSYDTLACLLRNRRLDAIEVLRRIKNLDVNAQVADKSPLLSVSVFSAGWKNMQFLLERGADPNVVDYLGETALITSINKADDASLEKVRLLLQYGADAQYAFWGEQTVFDLENYFSEDFLTSIIFESIIAHLAIIDSVGDIGITARIRRKILSEEILKNHFEKCEQQLEMMKSTTIHESVTMFKLLTESHMKISRYARNSEFALKFEEAMKVRRFLDPYYSITLHKRVDKAIHEAKLKEKAVAELYNIFRCRFRNYHAIFGEIVDYLTLDDLKNICKVYDLQESESFNLDTIFV